MTAQQAHEITRKAREVHEVSVSAAQDAAWVNFVQPEIKSRAEEGHDYVIVKLPEDVVQYVVGQARLNGFGIYQFCKEAHSVFHSVRISWEFV